MSKIAVVYWSGTGNTEAMAASVLEGIREAGAEAVLFKADEFNSTMIDAFDAIAFGCPSMGAEQLEEEEFAPMFASCEHNLRQKKIALFGRPSANPPRRRSARAAAPRIPCSPA